MLRCQSLQLLRNFVENKLFTIALHGQPLKKVVEYVESNSDFVFIWETNVDLNREVNVDVRNKSVQEILDQMFAGTGLEYRINGKQVIIRQAQTASRPNAASRKRTVSGVVTDASGIPLIGASVSLKGESGKGVITDMEYITIDLDHYNKTNTAVVGGIAGAAAGQAIGGDSKGTLIGAGIGALLAAGAAALMDRTSDGIRLTINTNQGLILVDQPYSCTYRKGAKVRLINQNDNTVQLQVLVNGSYVTAEKNDRDECPF